MPGPTELAPGADALAGAIRELLEHAVRSQDPEGIAAATQLVREATAELSDLRSGPWVVGGTLPSPYNTVLGPGNPVAPPVVLTKHDAEGVRGEVCFGTVYEGAPGLVHGGMLACVMDQVFGEAGIAAKVAGMTVGLELRYARPTPVLKDLVLEGHVVAAGDRIVEMAGTITCEGEVTVTATATFFRITEAHARRIFQR